MNNNKKNKLHAKGGAIKMLPLMLLLLMSSSCVSPRLNNTQRLLEHPQFKSAAIAAPRFVEDALKTITRLEKEIEAK